jgi:hypothetical protein
MWAKDCCGFAEINHGKVTSKAHGFNIDGNHTHAGVRVWEGCYTEVSTNAIFRYWDGHAIAGPAINPVQVFSSSFNTALHLVLRPHFLVHFV